MIDAKREDELARLNEPRKVHMDPNSQHQIWSLWTWTITPERKQMPAFGSSRNRVLEIKTNLARFANKCFGNTGQMNVSQYSDGRVIVKCRVEGHPVHDPKYVLYIKAQWHRFLTNGFGQRCTIEFNAKLEAGDAENGKPRDQLIILPAFHMGVNHK